jgi:phosphoribosylformimino-5-aminoimidazole carboxamide ribotide isomerase
MLGPDLALVEEVVAAAPGAKVVAAGGIGSDEDLTSLDSVGATGAIVGRALYEGAVSLPSS